MSRELSKLEEVAKLCNVSTTTVTRAFHENSKISSQKREEILETAKKLGYTPKKYNKSIEHIKKAKKYIAFIGDCSMSHKIISAADSVLSKQGYTMIFGNTSDDPTLEIQKIIDLKPLVDGFIIIPCMNESSYNLNYIKDLSSKVPVVILLRDAGLESLPNVCYSLYETNIKAMNSLINNGHKNIALISHTLSSKQNTDKLLAYQDALKGNGIPFRGEYILVNNSEDIDNTAEIEKFILNHTEVTAYVTSNRVQTIATISAFNNLGIKLKENVALIANHNSGAVLNSAMPISCITANHKALGTSGANQMIYVLNNFKESKKNNKPLLIASTLHLMGTEVYPTTPIKLLALK